MKFPRAPTDLLGSSGHSPATLSSLITVATGILIIASLYWAQALLIPVALAMLLTFLLSPVAGALERLALGRIVSVILVVVLAFSLLGGIGWVVSRQFASLANELPKYTVNIRQKIADVRGAGKGGALEKVQKSVDEVTSEIRKGDYVKVTTPSVVLKRTQKSVFWGLFACGSLR
jgi:predicted PurR-regulated permease PerM